jgi:DNA polymerase-1
MPIVAVDTETTGLLAWKGARPFAICIAGENLVEDYLYIQFEVNPYTRQVEYDKVNTKLSNCDIKWIRSFLANPKIDKVFHHRKFDQRMLEMAGFEIRGKCHDTAFAAKICNTLEPHYKLKPLAQKYLGVPITDQDALRKLVEKYRKTGKDKGYLVGAGNSDIDEDYWLPNVFLPENDLNKIYCVTDTLDRTLGLWHFYEEGMNQLNVRHIYDREMELYEVLYEMETKGLYTDYALIKQRIQELTFECLRIEMKLKEKFGSFNLDSGQQVADVLYNKLKLPITDRTDPSPKYPNGQPKTDTPTLKKFRDNPYVDLLLQHSGWTTGKQYFVNYEHHYVKETSTIHASVNQTDTRTWRLSCKDPNLQNVSNPETSGGLYVVNGREVFKPRPGYFWMVNDYAQLELRIFASRANETKLIKAFLDGRDPHNETRENVPYLAGLPKEKGRKLAKNTNFTVINCGGAGVLLKKYGVPLDEGEPCIKGFYNAYPASKRRQKEAEQMGREYGYILNAYNRKLNVDPMYGYRATSYDIQSSACDLIKRAMIKLAKFFKQNLINGYMLLQIHDELIIELAMEYINDFVLFKDIIKIMEDHGGAFCIPMPVEAKIATENWSKKSLIKFA